MAVAPANDRVYSQGIEKLRFPDRLERLEVDRVARLCLNDGKVSTLLDVGTGSALFAETFFKAGDCRCGCRYKPGDD